MFDNTDLNSNMSHVLLQTPKATRDLRSFEDVCVAAAR